MGKWKNLLKRGLVAALTAVLLGSGMPSVVLPVSAEEVEEIVQEDGTDAQVAAVQQQIAALPTVEEVQALSAEEREASRVSLQEVKKAYDALTEEQKQQISGAQELLDALTGYLEGQAAPPAEEVQEEVIEFTVPVPEEELAGADNEELLKGYVEQQIYAPFNSGIALLGEVGEGQLTGIDKEIYLALKAKIKEVAAGNATSTEFLLDGISFTLTAAEVAAAGNNVGKAFQNKVHTGDILSYLMMDCPYELYWFDKEVGMGTRYASQGYPSTGDYKIIDLTFSFTVAVAYRQSGQLLVVDHAGIAKVNHAVAKAQAIVNQCAGLSDEEKLRAYKDEICALTEYNFDVLAGGVRYGDPWQLIYVFDEDPSTKVVCEGYAKAFQYLCDLSTFQEDTTCYTVVGDMNGGAHMWNVVRMGDGKSYLVDVTNCDTGMAGHPDKLFLAGGTGSVDAGYTVNGISYVYETGTGENQKELFGEEILTLAGTEYDDKAPVISMPAAVEVTYGDAPSNYSFAGFTATQKGTSTEVPGTFSWKETSYGSAGEKKLTLVFTPDDLNTYSAATRLVPVKVNPKPITPVLTIVDQTVDYTGQAIIPAHRLENGGSALIEGTDYTVQCTNNINAGTGTLKAVPKAGGNYTWNADTTTGNFTIRPIAYPGEKTASVSTRYGKAGTFDFGEMLPSGVTLTLTGTEDPDQIFAENPKLNGKVVSYSLVNEKAKVGSTARVTLEVVSNNYHTFEITLTVKMSDKLAQSDFKFSAATQKKTYGDADYVLAASGAVKDSKVTYTSSDPTVATVDEKSGSIHILKPGTTVIRAVASETEDYLDASASYELQVVRKTLKWDVSGLQAVDKEGTVVEGKASLYGVLGVSGIVSGDEAYAVFDCPAGKLNGKYASTVPGSQKVTLSWADGQAVLLQGAKAEYYVMPDALPEFTGRINPVSDKFPTPPESTDEKQLKLEVETGISTVPDAFKDNEKLNTPAKIESWMKTNIQERTSGIAKENIIVYDIVLMINENGQGWKEATTENFPSAGLTITLPYPKGTGEKTQDFTVCHLFTKDMNGHRAGETEYPEVTKTKDGIQFKVHGLSPVSIGWKDVKASAGNDKQETKDASPATGDQSPIAGYAVLMLLALGGIGVVSARRRRG